MRGLIDPHVYVKNIGEDMIELPEIGGYELDPGEEIDMNVPQDERPGHTYGPHNAQAVITALTKLPGTVLYQEREAGNLEYRVEPKAG